MPRPILLAALAAAVLLVSVPAVLRAESRMALVIGNSGYAHIGKLKNPSADARLISDRLRQSGFTVEDHYDLTEDAMGEAVDGFADRARDADVVAIYFAGHGLQKDARNYLMPVDANLTSEASIAREGIALDDILASVREVPISLIFLDACRNNPFANNIRPPERGNMGGLAVVRPSGDMLIAYATLAGTTAADGSGKNSPFARALARHMLTPDIEVSVMMKRVTGQVREETGEEQHPQQVTQMAREFYFQRSSTPVTNVSVADYRGLLTVYPNRVTAGQEVSVVADVPVECTPAFFNLAPDKKLTPIPRRFFKTVDFGNGQIRYEISPGSRYGLVVQEDDAPGTNHLGYLCEPEGMDGRDAKSALLRAVLSEIADGHEDGRVSAAGYAGIAFQVRSFTIR